MQYEWRKSVVRGGPPVLSDTRIEGAQFRSVYAFPSPTAQIIRTQKTMKNLKGKMVYSDTLLIDVDHEENVQKALDILDRLKVYYIKCDTGNRGMHIHVPIKPMQGVHVIYSQKNWLQSVGLWPLIDTSIYRPAGQFRCIGATHRKTGRIKHVVEEVDGRTLEIAMLVPPPTVVADSWQVGEGTPESVFIFNMNMLAERGPGQRHMHLYILFRSGQKAGLGREELEECLRWWNSWQTHPHTDNMMTKKLESFK